MMPGVHVTWQYTGERCIGFSAKDEDGFPVILRPDFAAVNVVHPHDTMTINFYRHHLVPREAKGTSIMRKRLWKEFEQTTIDGVPDAARKLRMLGPAQLKVMRDSAQMRCSDHALQQENEETLDMYTHVDAERKNEPASVLETLFDDFTSFQHYRSEWGAIFARDIYLWKQMCATRSDITVLKCENAALCLQNDSDMKCNRCDPLEVWLQWQEKPDEPSYLHLKLYMAQGCWYLRMAHQCRGQVLVYHIGFPCPCQLTHLMLDDIVDIFQTSLAHELLS